MVVRLCDECNSIRHLPSSLVFLNIWISISKIKSYIILPKSPGDIVLNYYNDTLGNSVDDSNSVKLYDTVPQEAESLTIARNRLFLGNYKTGLENPSF